MSNSAPRASCVRLFRPAILGSTKQHAVGSLESCIMVALIGYVASTLSVPPTFKTPLANGTRSVSATIQSTLVRLCSYASPGH
jgi:hypothetical protein